MLKTDKGWKVLLVAFTISAAAAFIITGLESLIGSDKVFIGAILLLPVVFIWCLITGERERVRHKDRRF